ncbi:hypothetical protein pb186bvf_016404 [Paramecium bursaria]
MFDYHLIFQGLSQNYFYHSFGINEKIFILKYIMDIEQQHSNNLILEQEILREESMLPEAMTKQIDDGVFIEESSAKKLEKLLSLKECSYKERLAYVKHLSELIQEIGEDAITNLNLIIQSILEDADEVKKSFIAQMKQLQEILQTPLLIKQHIIFPLMELLKSTNVDIKELAGRQLVWVTPILSDVDRGNIILTQVIQMAHDDNNEDNVKTAIKLFGELAYVFGQELSESFIAFEILSKGEDPKQPICKEAVLQIANVSAAVSIDFMKNRLLPFYQRKTEDRSWHTRKACVDVIVKLAEVQQKENLEFATQRMIALLDDQNKWVKQGAYKNLGKFIMLFENDPKPNEKLLEYYLKMVDADVRELEQDNEIVIDCAQYFPAVLIIYKKWPLMQKVFQKLIVHKDKRVRLPLASSMHELAKVLGSETAYNDLLKIVEQFLLDQADEIKYGVIQNIGKFFDYIDYDKRETLIDIVMLIQKDKNKNNWRIRELIAKQIGHFAQVFNEETVFQTIMPISIKLCYDNVYTVRKQAAKQIYSLYEKFQDSERLQPLISNIHGFASSDLYYIRQSFVYMCRNLLKYDSFNIHFLEFLVKLGQDDIKNVRICVAKVLRKYLFKDQGVTKNNTPILRLWNIIIKDESVMVALNIKERTSIFDLSPGKIQSE